MKPFRIIFLVSCISFFISSCAIDRRLHNPGYHLTWNNGKHVSAQAEKKEPLAEKMTVSETDTFPSNYAGSEEKAQPLNHTDTIAPNGRIQPEIETTRRKSISNQARTLIKKQDHSRTNIKAKTLHSERKNSNERKQAPAFDFFNILIGLSIVVILFGIFVLLIASVPFWGIALTITGAIGLAYLLSDMLYFEPLFRLILILCFALLLIACGIFLISIGIQFWGILVITAVSILTFAFLVLVSIYVLFGQLDQLLL